MIFWIRQVLILHRINARMQDKEVEVVVPGSKAHIAICREGKRTFFGLGRFAWPARSPHPGWKGNISVVFHPRFGPPVFFEGPMHVLLIRDFPESDAVQCRLLCWAVSSFPIGRLLKKNTSTKHVGTSTLCVSCGEFFACSFGGVRIPFPWFENAGWCWQCLRRISPDYPVLYSAFPRGKLDGIQPSKRVRFWPCTLCHPDPEVQNA
jgi:hypothetical protein